MTDLDRQLAEAIKRIRIAEGRWYRLPLEGSHLMAHRDALPDPLSDTPEGDHAFMEITRWAESRGFRFGVEHFFDGDYMATVMRLAPNWELAGQTHNPDCEGPDGLTFKSACILALAAALEEQG